jgi:membrane protein DedA with SNARE-associated domain
VSVSDQLSDPRLWSIIILLSLIGVVSKLVYYQVGKSGSQAVAKRVPQVTPERLGQISGWFDKHGSRVLAISSVPGIGSALAAVAGIAGIRIIFFVVWVFFSGLVRNWLVVILFGQTLSLFSSS